MIILKEPRFCVAQILQNIRQALRSPASLLATAARGCNEIYHLEYFLLPILYPSTIFFQNKIKQILSNQIITSSYTCYVLP